ncbi:hypothetical protein [Aquimarina aquimarini]|uniref:hypothetical protein n=1 Tax=Aquimarina aquimarini TaxID=1191734 RepID=UPI000D550810|nr:hypothetical protein [Aquimarina aquimarini]
MKKVKGKKLSLNKLNITKLETIASIKGGHRKTDDPGDLFHHTSVACETKNINCTSPTIIGLG